MSTQECLGYMSKSAKGSERKQSLLKEAPDDFRKQIFQGIRELDERVSKEEMEHLEKNGPWKKCGRTGGTSVTRIAASGSQSSEMEAELLSDFVVDRRVTGDPDIVGSAPTPKTMEVSTSNEEEGKSFFGGGGSSAESRKQGKKIL